MDYTPDKSLPKYQEDPAKWDARDPRRGQFNVESGFKKRLLEMKNPRVLEVGSRRVVADKPTIRRDWAPHASEYIGLDMEPGEDVDLVADLHALSRHVEPDSIDAIICHSVLEHVERPWVAAGEMAKVLKPGGWIYVSSHQTFPIHGFPKDYWRFTREAMESLFGPEMGFGEINSFYAFPCDIRAERTPLTWKRYSFLIVALTACKERQPKEWILR